MLGRARRPCATIGRNSWVHKVPGTSSAWTRKLCGARIGLSVPGARRRPGCSRVGVATGSHLQNAVCNLLWVLRSVAQVWVHRTYGGVGTHRGLAAGRLVSSHTWWLVCYHHIMLVSSHVCLVATHIRLVPNHAWLISTYAKLVASHARLVICHRVGLVTSNMCLVSCHGLVSDHIWLVPCHHIGLITSHL